MVIDRQILQEYPFVGTFFTFGKDKTKPLDEQVETDIEIMTTVCDIQGVSGTNSNGFITSTFKIFFPITVGEDIVIKRGDTFRGNFYGLNVNGIIDSIVPSPMGGCEVILKDMDV